MSQQLIDALKTTLGFLENGGDYNETANTIYAALAAAEAQPAPADITAMLNRFASACRYGTDHERITTGKAVEALYAAPVAAAQPVDRTRQTPQTEVDKTAKTLAYPTQEQEREHFDYWLSMAKPFDANVGRVEHSIKTDAAWQGWMARAASEAFQEVLQRDENTHPRRHPELPILPPSTELEKMAEAAGMENFLNYGAASCVSSEGCNGVSQEHLERFAELVRADERRKCIDLLVAQRPSDETYAVGGNVALAMGEAVDACIAALGGPSIFRPTKAERVHAIVNAGPFPGMSEAFDAHMGAACWTDPAYAPDASTWAAAWKAAKAQPESAPVAWIRHDWSGTGSRSLSFDGPPSPKPVRDEVVNPIWTPLYAAPVAAAQPLDDFDRPIVYDTNAVDAVTHALTGDEGEDDSVTVLKNLARYVSTVWPGKTALQVLTELEEQTAAQPESAPVAVPQAFDWPDSAILSLMNAVGDGPHSEEDVAVTRRFLRRVEEVRADMLAAAPTAPAPQPLTRNQMRELMEAAGYSKAAAQAKADFINGVRHGELAHGIKGAA